MNERLIQLGSSYVKHAGKNLAVKRNLYVTHTFYNIEKDDITTAGITFKEL